MKITSLLASACVFNTNALNAPQATIGPHQDQDQGPQTRSRIRAQGIQSKGIKKPEKKSRGTKRGRTEGSSNVGKAVAKVPRALTENRGRCRAEAGPAAGVENNYPRDGVVKIWLHTRDPDFTEPWKASPFADGTCTGFVIAIEEPVMEDGVHTGAWEKVYRIMTNAHCVEHAHKGQITFKRPGAEHGKFTGDVLYVYQEADLALVRVVPSEQKKFEESFDPKEIISFADGIDLNQQIVLRGYPDGENLLCVEGKISRMTTIDYSRQRDFITGDAYSLLVIQTQAPVNSGNSGGPAFQWDAFDLKWKCVGVAVASCAGHADNVGFLIPRQVVAHFLEDVKRRSLNPDHVMGFPRFGLTLQNTEDKNTRIFNQLPTEHVFDFSHHGQLINGIAKGSTWDGILQVGDTIVEVDGHPINHDGNYQPKIEEEGLQEEIHMSWIIAKKFFGDETTIRYFRNGQLETAIVVHKVPKKLLEDLLMTKNGLARGPAYAVTGPLGVTEVTRQYLAEMYNAHDGDDVSTVPEQYVRAKALNLPPPAGYEGQPRRIVSVAGVLTEAIDDDIDGHVITHVNGVQVYNLQHYVDLVNEAMESARTDVQKKSTSSSDEDMEEDEEQSQGEEIVSGSPRGALRQSASEQDDDDESDSEDISGDEESPKNRRMDQDSSSSDEDSTDEYDWSPEDYIKIELDPKRVVALGPVQKLAKETAEAAADHNVAEKSLSAYVDYIKIHEKIDEHTRDKKLAKWRKGEDNLEPVKVDPTTKAQLEQQIMSAMGAKNEEDLIRILAGQGAL